MEEASQGSERRSFTAGLLAGLGVKMRVSRSWAGSGKLGVYLCVGVGVCGGGGGRERETEDVCVCVHGKREQDRERQREGER